MKATQMPSGVTARRNKMNTMTQTLSLSASAPRPVVLALVIGLALTFVAGMSGATVLHDAAHDARHALAFPCH